MARSKKVLLILLVFLSGLLSASFFSFGYFFISLSFVGAGILFVISRDWRLALAVFLVFGGGFWYANHAIKTFSQSRLFNYHGQNVSVTGQVVGRLEQGKYENKVSLASVTINGAASKNRTKILVFVPLSSDFGFGDRLQFHCLLMAPEKIDNFNYPLYLAAKNISTICAKPQELVSLAKCQNWRCRGLNGFFALFASRLERKIFLLLPSPKAELLQGILFGETGGLPQELKENFKQTGTTHLMAVSGLNLTILSFLITNVLFTLHASRKKAFIFTSIILFIFIGLVGFSASSVRAGLMGMLGSLALISGRLNLSLNSIFLAAAVLLLFNPMLLVADLGYQLSFLAMLGLYFFTPFFQKICRFLPEKYEIRSSLVMTLSAQTFVLPWLIYKFGRLSLISPLTNLLLLPLMPVLMAAGLLVLAVSFFLPASIVAIFSWPLWLALNYIIAVVTWGARLPFSSLNISLSLGMTVLTYSLILLLVRYKIRKRQL